ncbi:MAG TPA: efflux RND transporter periplasmic adaptor subunit [Polyangia bacterium]|nr:efflux RND transporter periplasmic adaptor subunit [Polyangia bacterium]
MPPNENEHEAPSPRELRKSRLVIAIGVAVVAVGVVGLYLRAVSRTNHEALSQAPRPVSVEKSQAGTFRAVRTYVGTTDAWNTAKVGPQYISAYVGTVLVRPGAVVRRGEVLATLDCRNASASSKEIAARARALAERQVAGEHEAARVKEMAEGNFASKNEAEQLAAKATSEAQEVESLKATLVSRSLEVDDCILRAPFAGEVSERFADPGAYLRPGNAVATVIDRSVVRITADAPEADFAVVAPETPVAIEIEATGVKLMGKVSRRAPAADEATRTVHFEIDVPNEVRPKTASGAAADKTIHPLPVGTTAQLAIEVGKPQAATLVPLRAATIRADKASVFAVEDGVARRRVVPILGERAGVLYLDSKLTPGTPIVIEGRALLDDGDRVAAKEQP